VGSSPGGGFLLGDSTVDLPMLSQQDWKQVDETSQADLG